VSLGDVVNSDYSEDLPHLSYDGLSLYFISDRPVGSQTGFDIWVSHRASPNHPWGQPRNLGAPINTGGNERGPCLSRDGHYLFFSSDRDPGFGSQDLWASYREWIGGLIGWGAWQQPVNLGRGVNTSDPDFGAAFLENEATGIPTLLFGRREGFGDADIYVSEIEADGSAGEGVLVPELSTPFDDLRPTVRPDGLELFFNSNRPGSIPNDLTISNDLWTSSRQTILSPWSTPRNAGPGINTPFDERFPALSADGRTLIFSSNRPGTRGPSDLYMSTRLDPHPLP
jgi:hypothetical protein